MASHYYGLPRTSPPPAAILKWTRPTLTTFQPATPQLWWTQPHLAHISKKITNLTPLEKMDLPNCPTCHPSTNGLGRTPRTFRKKIPNLTPLVKMDSPYCHYFPTCHPSAIMDSATLVRDALSQCNDNWQLSLHCLSVAVMHMHIASWICIRHAFRPSLRKMSDFPEFCSQQPLKIFQKFLNRIVA